MEGLIDEILDPIEPCNLFEIIGKLKISIEENRKLSERVTSDFIDLEFLNEIKSVATSGVVNLYFGKSLRDMKIVIYEQETSRVHNIFVEYMGPRKLVISPNVNLPYSDIISSEYSNLREIVEVFTNYINNLTDYFYELESIDLACTIMDPKIPSFRTDYRKIYLDERTWLHLEITRDGLARNLHLVGQSEHWNNKLQAGLKSWDHDKAVIQNILSTFELSCIPKPAVSSPSNVEAFEIENILPIINAECGICLAVESVNEPGVPQPLCQNVACGIYYHRICLYQWLVASAGGRPPAFGVANGTCPACMQPITCNEKET